MSEMIAENNRNDDVDEFASTDYDESETEYAERKPRSRERGPDKNPRAYHVNSMRNLAQFNDKPQEFVQYLKDEKGIDIVSYSKLTKKIWIITGFIIVMVVGLYLYDWYKNKKTDDDDANKISNSER